MACYQCFKAKDKRCAIDDDIVNDCIAKMIEADAIVIGTPTYFANMTPEMKALIDRAGWWRSPTERSFSHAKSVRRWRSIGAAGGACVLTPSTTCF